MKMKTAMSDLDSDRAMDYGKGSGSSGKPKSSLGKLNTGTLNPKPGKVANFSDTGQSSAGAPKDLRKRIRKASVKR